jgi:hypothetical protein
MKVGDIVKCKFQPKSSGYDTKTGCMKPMLYHIKEELGIFIGVRDKHAGIVFFPQFNYQHYISFKSLEVISESR